MKLLTICFVFNELKYLPHTIDYYRKNGSDIYVIDNFSTDGTYEWLVENNIPCHRIDTGESFDLRILQKAIINILPELKPDWVIYSSADLYFIANMRLKDYIEKVESMGYNQLSMMCWSAFNTGEVPGLPLPAHYFHALPWRHVTMISKYDSSYDMNGDNVTINDARCYEGKHCMAINYGACKPRKEQEEKLKRRRKAWENGMRPQQGRHFLKGEKAGWIRDRKTLTDLRKAPEYKYILRALSSEQVYEKDNYDKLYNGSEMYRKHYSDTVYFNVWKYIAGRLNKSDKILELGCGPGQLAELLHDRGFSNYSGIDFSSVAIKMARERVPSGGFRVSDLRDIDYSEYAGSMMVCTETLEHIQDDIALIKKLPKGRIIFSVPDFMCESHYRTYNSEQAIREYYRGIIDIDIIKAFAIGSNRTIFVGDGYII